MKPFVKWVGGKTKLLGQLLPLFPKKIGTYYEPFLGGGAPFWSLSSQGQFERACLSDWNDELMATYRVVRDFPEDLINRLEQLQTQYKLDPPGVFELWRDPQATLKLQQGNPVLRAARMIFLNKTCFNGLYRVNQKGQFNASWGKNPNPLICDPDNIRACSVALNRHVTLGTGDFEAAVATAQAGDAVYFDPPYVPLSVTSSFTGYTADGFGQKEQKRLALLVRSLMDRGVAVIASNSSSPLVREMYAGLEIHEVNAARSVNVKGDGRGPVKELVIVGRKAAVVSEWALRAED